MIELRERFCITLTSARELSVLIGCQAVKTLESSIEMTVVGKSGGVGNLTERLVGQRNLPRRKFDAQTSDVSANRAAECFPKYAGEMNRVDTGDFSDISENK